MLNSLSLLLSQNEYNYYILKGFLFKWRKDETEEVIR